MAIIKPNKNVFGTPMSFGKHIGSLAERVALEAPDYLYWFHEKELQEQYPNVAAAFMEAMNLFDEKPFLNAKCHGKVEGKPCTRPVVRFAVPMGSCDLTFWCDKCNPAEVLHHEYEIFTKYRDVVHHAYSYKYYSKSHAIKAVREIAEAKGFVGEVTDASVVKFLYGPDAEPTPV